MGMQVVTLNTWGTRGDWTRRLMAFQDGLRALDPDIVTLQETVLTDEAAGAGEWPRSLRACGLLVAARLWCRPGDVSGFS